MKKVSVSTVLDRARRIAAAQLRLVPLWVWAKRAAEGWAGVIAAVETLQTELVGMGRASSIARAAADATLDDLHDRTVEGLGKARSKYRREDPQMYETLRRAGCGGCEVLLPVEKPMT